MIEDVIKIKKANCTCPRHWPTGYVDWGELATVKSELLAAGVPDDDFSAGAESQGRSVRTFWPSL
jgi:hypothetical protein